MSEHRADRRADDHNEDPGAGAEPIAVIGLGCRFPGGADSPGEFWNLLLDGGDAVGELPGERWDFYRGLGHGYTAALRSAVRSGSHLRDIEGFDAEFFGISPREAELMDPQQRILLEVAWEALENAGLPPAGLAGGDAGVFVGICTDDYGRRQLEALPGIEAWTGIGGAVCASANRISHALDLRGPSLAVDTACSASLVAVHLACQSLRLAECPVALAAGVNLIISPGMTLTLGQAGALAPDGRSKPFDAAADGYGRGEGCGVLVLKRLRDARRDGDTVLAVVRGSAVNQDGRTNGIMAPCGAAQEHVIERACRHAGIPAGTVDYVEAHGTGTRLGDRMEAAALATAYGKGRDAADPCLVGSVKSNIGHLEGAAGVAGLIKAVLALREGVIPASLVATERASDISWEESGLSLVTKAMPWPRRDRPRRAGVSGFGYGGTVGHVILEEPPAEAAEPAGAPGSGDPVFPLSAGSEPALRKQAERLADWLDGAGASAPLDAVGRTLAVRRSHLSRRAVVVAQDAGELSGRLRRLAAAEPSDGIATGAPVPAGEGGGLVWVFSGHGSQWSGMGRELLAAEPAFAAVVDRLEPIFRAEIGFSPREVLTGGDLTGVDRVQTMIFVMQVALAELWRSRGVTPDAVIGHSVGEIAAAVTAGGLGLADGARLSCRRSRLLRRVAGGGAMAMAGLPFEEAAERLAGRSDVVAAICSSPASSVVAGDPAAVAEVSERWAGEGITVRRVASDVAFHSPQMDAIAAELAVAAGDLEPAEPFLPMYSTALADPSALTGPVPRVALDGAYWAANLRNPVRLAGAVAAAAADGHRAFLEISPHPVVTHSVTETLLEEGVDEPFVGATLRRNRPERAAFLTALGAAHCHGVAVAWDRLRPSGGLAALPTTPWRHRPFWRDPEIRGAGTGGGHDVDEHVLLGDRVPVAGGALGLWRTFLDDSNRPYPGSHTINEVEIVPAAVLLETFVAAASRGRPGDRPVLTDVAMRRPLFTGGLREVQVVLDEAGVRISSRPEEAGRDDSGEAAWTEHASARVSERRAIAPPPPGDRELPLMEPDFVMRRLSEVGVPTTGFFWDIQELRGDTRILRACVRFRPGPDGAPAWAPVFDAVMTVAPAAYPGPPVLRMVVQAAEVWTRGDPVAEATIEVVVDDAAGGLADAVVTDADGRVVARLSGLKYAEVGDPAAGSGPRRLVHETVWRPMELERAAGPGRPVVLVGPPGEPRDRVGGRLACPVFDGPDDLVVPAGPADVLAVAAPGEEAALLTGIARRLAAGEARLWGITAGAAAAAPDRVPDLAFWGAGRVLANESPAVWGGLLDLDPDDLDGTAALIPDVLARAAAAPADGAAHEDVIALRGGTASRARLARLEGAPGGAPLECAAAGTYLVSGAFGEIGLRAARHLAGLGARRLVLADDAPFPERPQWEDVTDGETRRRVAAVQALEAAGVTVRVVTLDPATGGEPPDTDELGLPPVRGIVHIAPEPAGSGAATAWRLHEAFPGDVDFFVLMAPGDHLTGTPGRMRAAVTAASHDALVLHRRSRGRRDALSLAWSEVSADEVLEAWGHAHRYGAGCYAVVRPPAGGAAAPLLSEVGAAEPEDVAADGDGSGLAGFSGLSPELLAERLRADVGAQISAEMRLPPESLDPRRPLADQGLDSVMTVAVRRRLERRFGVKLPPTLLWQRPTVLAVAGHLAELVDAG
ncbi:type I polyketide synthase [Actinomadura formosensis]|uniref:type I polyketide synthase n=1 Tax=Actinomadura formosensis TaxID=60706 RepID=UPI003D8B0450